MSPKFWQENPKEAFLYNKFCDISQAEKSEPLWNIAPESFHERNNFHFGAYSLKTVQTKLLL